MALLDDCFFCSLSVAASVIGVYTLVAYLIAFLMEIWWINNASVSLPYPAYILSAGYLIVTIFSGILLRGLSIKNTLFLLEWLLVVAALFVPEGILVYFMSIHYWNIRSLYGLMELTCWVCRAIINVSGIICVQSLYSNWREEKEVVRRLRDLNMTRVIPNRRNSVSVQANGLGKNSTGTPSLYPPPPQTLNNGAFVSSLRRSGSMVSVLSRPQSAMMFSTPPPSIPLHPMLAANPALNMTFNTSEFDASQFDVSLVSSLQSSGLPQITKSYSLMDLGSVRSVSGTPRKSMSVIDFEVEKKLPMQTQSLDRRLVRKNLFPESEGLYISGRLNNAYFVRYRNDFPFDPSVDFLQNRKVMYSRNVNGLYPNKPNSRSKHSVGSDSEDFHKYRDIAL